MVIGINNSSLTHIDIEEYKFVGCQQKQKYQQSISSKIH